MLKRAAFLLAVLLPAAAGAQEAQIVAIAVRTEPAGATVRVNRLARTWVSPCDIADFSLRRGQIELEVSLAGYETVKRSVIYDGEIPVHLEFRLKPLQGAAPKPVQEAPRGPGSAEVPPPAAPPRPSTDAVPGGVVRLRVASSTSAVRVMAGKAALADGSRPGELLLPLGLSEKVTVEFLDPKTGAVVGTVEALPAESAAPAPASAPATEGDRLGKVQLVHRMYGVFVKLDPGLQISPGEEILIIRDGREVARTQIQRVIRQDEKYPDGAVMIPKADEVRKGDEVRRPQKP
jgi:hypothetical protein